jgi:hypothetical protein
MQEYFDGIPIHCPETHIFFNILLASDLAALFNDLLAVKQNVGRTLHKTQMTMEVYPGIC